MQKKIAIIVLAIFMSNWILAQDNNVVKESFKVWGNCEMCKTTIEKSVKSVDGVKSGKWIVSEQKMTVKFDASKTSLNEIKKAIAAVGYDTEEFRATNESYNKLHHCCQYERPKE